MDTPANAVPDTYDGALAEVWANQGGVDRNEAMVIHAAETLADNMDDPEEFGKSFDRLPPGAQSAFEEALAVSPKPARYRQGTDEINYGPAEAALRSAITNPRISAEDGQALKEWIEGLDESSAQAVLDWFSGVYSR